MLRARRVHVAARLLRSSLVSKSIDIRRKKLPHNAGAPEGVSSVGLAHHSGAQPCPLLAVSKYLMLIHHLTEAR